MIQRAKSAGIISAIGDDLVYRNVPFFRWDQEEHYRNVGAWAIDAFVTQEASKALQSRYSIVPVDFDRAAFLDDGLNARVSSAGMMPDASALGEVVRANVREPKADLYVVVLAGRTGVATTATPAEGMGVLRLPSFGSDRYYYHALYRIVVVDGHTFEPLAIQEASVDDSLLHGGPYEQFEPEHWAEENEHVTEADLEWIRDRIKALIARTLPDTLLRLNVTAS